MIERVCAIDVAKASGKVCVRVGSNAGRRVSKVWDVAATSGAVGEFAGHDERRRSPRGRDWCRSAAPRVGWTAVATGPVDGPAIRQFPRGALATPPRRVAAQPPGLDRVATVRAMTPAAN